MKRKKKAPAAHSIPAGSRPSKDFSERWKVFAVCISLAAITFAVYGQTLGYEFVNYDDDSYVYENGTVSAGLTLNGIAWAFSGYRLANWVPLTMVSHMLDCQFYGLKAGGHHLTNILLHAGSVIILFLALRRMTRTLWRSAFVAALFAVHPLHVESVAWVAERKDTLSGFFFVLTLWVYAFYTSKPASLGRYLTVLLLFALGLMSKGMLVTLPFILLLLDFWPLNRFSQTLSGFKDESPLWSKNLSVSARLVIEKIPLLALSLVFCLLTILAQSHAIQPLKEYPLPVRLGNALVSCVIYIIQMFYPAKLAVFYPYPDRLPVFEIIAAFIFLAAFSLAVFVWRQKRPYLLSGWAWYLIMLLPVIGLIQVGYQARADRYTYLPQIGLYLILTWLAAEAATRLRDHRTILGVTAAIVLAALIAVARAQTACWHDSESLWTHALASTHGNSIANNNLGLFLVKKGRINEAAGHFQTAVEIDPHYAEAYMNLGNIYYLNGRADPAITCYQNAAEIQPKDTRILDDLGLAFAQKGEMDEAINCFQKAVTLDPNYDDAVYNLHVALGLKRQTSPTNGPASNVNGH